MPARVEQIIDGLPSPEPIVIRPQKCIYLPRLDLETGKTNILQVVCLEGDVGAEARSLPTAYLLNKREVKPYLLHRTVEFETFATITAREPYPVPPFRSLHQYTNEPMTVELSISHENLFGEYVELGS